MEVQFVTGKILSNEKEAVGLRAITIELPKAQASTYTVPGQYCQIKVDPSSKPNFFAVRSPPDGRDIFSFIVKESESNSALVSSQPGSQVYLSDAMGKGFQIPEYFDKYKFDFPTTKVLLMACGSGISPIAAAIDSAVLGLKTTSYNSLFERQGTLYIGAKTPDHLPCQVDIYQQLMPYLNILTSYVHCLHLG